MASTHCYKVLQHDVGIKGIVWEIHLPSVLRRFLKVYNNYEVASTIQRAYFTLETGNRENAQKSVKITSCSSLGTYVLDCFLASVLSSRRSWQATRG